VLALGTSKRGERIGHVDGDRRGRRLEVGREDGGRISAVKAFIAQLDLPGRRGLRGTGHARCEKAVPSRSSFTRRCGIGGGRACGLIAREPGRDEGPRPPTPVACQADSRVLVGGRFVGARRCEQA
jgi:hypothetical protein